MIKKIVQRHGKISMMTACLMILSLIMCTYHPQDQSFFFISNRSLVIHNIGGSLGAHIAGLLFFLFGGTAFTLLFFLWYVWYLRVMRREKDILDQIIASIIGTIIMPIIASLHGWKLFEHGFSSGGYLGIWGKRLLLHFFDYTIILIGLYAILGSIFITLVSLSDIKFLFMYINKFFGLIKRLNIHQKIQQLFYCTLRCIMQFIYTTKRTLLHNPLQDCDILAIDYQEFLQDQTPFSISQVAQPIALNHKIPHDKQNPIFSTQQAESKEEDENFSQNKKKAVSVYDLPLKRLLNTPKVINQQLNKDEQELAQRLEEKLARFGIVGSVVSIKTGPVVTLFEYQPHIEAKLSKILSLEDDLALALQALSIRIIAPIPGTPVVGFEVSRKIRETVPFAYLVQETDFYQRSEILPIILGVDTIGDPVIVDLVSMPHLLVAGATGSGKSIALNVFLVSLLYRCTPMHLKLVLIDPKRLEFAPYADIPHLLFPIVTQAKEAILILQWLVSTMEERYEQMAECGVRNITDFNNVCAQFSMNPMPFIVVIIDELADLMMVAGKEIEDNIARLAQMARASGIHLIVATQRPSVDVITGIIKANFSSRISFRVATKIDARTIMDQSGAEKLLGKGDMLYVDTASTLRRIHGVLITHHEVERVAQHLRSLQAPSYLSLQDITMQTTDIDVQDQELFNQVLYFLTEVDEISISLLQRKFKIGYNRSARIIEMLEARGKVLSVPGSKMRKVLS